MPNRIIRVFALSIVSAALAIGGLGAASASADRSHPEDGAHHCKGLKGKQKKNCEKNHHGGHHGVNHH